MVINLRNVLSGVENPLEFRYVADMSDYELYGIKPLKTGVVVNGKVEKRPGFLTLETEILAELDTLCASCGKGIKKPLRVKTHNLLVTHTDSLDDEYVIISDDVVDLAPIVTDAITLNMEMRPLCNDDCKGFCPGCGVDLNGEPYRCPKPTNPALEKLKEKF